jgi:hypothetical protein
MILCISFPTQKSPVFTDATQKVNYGEKGHHCINRFYSNSIFCISYRYHMDMAHSCRLLVNSF